MSQQGEQPEPGDGDEELDWRRVNAAVSLLTRGATFLVPAVATALGEVVEFVGAYDPRSSESFDDTRAEFRPGSRRPSRSSRPHPSQSSTGCSRPAGTDC